MSNIVENWFKDEEIEKLISKGSRLFASKSYEESAEVFGEACALYSEKHEEEDPLLLFWYGRALFNVAVSQSEVFGAVEQESGNKEEPEYSKSKKAGFFQFSEAQQEDEGEDGEDGENGQNGKNNESDEKVVDKGKKKVAIVGDEGDEGSDEEEEEGEEKSDFELSWELLDLSRTLFAKKLDSVDNDEEKKTVTKLLSETYDLLGEVSLESGKLKKHIFAGLTIIENYSQAVEDLESSLKLKNELHPIESPLISEIHYKLSLAYEFVSPEENSSHRSKAIFHTEKAIESIKKQFEKEGEGDKSLIDDLEQRLKELKSVDRIEEEQKKAIKGMLGLDEPTDKLPGSSAPANDISGLIRKKPSTKGDSKGSSKKARV